MHVAATFLVALVCPIDSDDGCCFDLLSFIILLAEIDGEVVIKLAFLRWR